MIPSPCMSLSAKCGRLALAAVHAIEHESLGSESLKMVVALHYGTGFTAISARPTGSISPSSGQASTWSAGSKRSQSRSTCPWSSATISRARMAARCDRWDCINCAASTRRTNCSYRRRMTIPDAARKNVLRSRLKNLFATVSAISGSRKPYSATSSALASIRRLGLLAFHSGSRHIAAVGLHCSRPAYQGISPKHCT